MRRTDADAAVEWVDGQEWLSADGRGLRLGPGTAIVRHRVETNGSAAGGCGVTSLLLHDCRPPSFAGGLLAVDNVWPASDDDLRVVREVTRGLGVPIAADPEPWFFGFDVADFDGGCLLSLAVMFGWDGYAVVAGRRMLIETDHDLGPALVTDQLSGWLAEALANNGAVAEPWPFRSRFLRP